MFYNDKDIGIGIIYYENDEITIYSKDYKEMISFTFNNDSKKLTEYKLNERVDIIPNIYPDTSFGIDDTYFLFNINYKEDSIFLTRLDNDNYLLEVNITKPDKIYYPAESYGYKFNSLKINAKFSILTKPNEIVKKIENKIHDKKFNTKENNKSITSKTFFDILNK